MSVIRKGQVCIQAAKNAYHQISTQRNIEEAVKCLSDLKEHGKEMQEVSKESKAKCCAKEQELEAELLCLMRERDSYESTVLQLDRKKRDEENKLSRQKQKLHSAEKDRIDALAMLHSAECELREAKGEKVAAGVTAAAIGVVVGVVVGVFTFGTGGVAAGVSAANILFAAIQNRCRIATEKIAKSKQAIEKAQQEITSSIQCLKDTVNKINHFERLILSNKKRTTEVHNRISENKITLAIQGQALELLELFTLASEDATQTTQRLEKIIQKANEEQNLRIIRNNGTVMIARSVVEAWEEISFYQGRIAFIT